LFIVETLYNSKCFKALIVVRRNVVLIQKERLLFIVETLYNSKCFKMLIDKRIF
jgi:hypothetical protein